MDEDQILQSIIADPNVVDPSIDVSRLRKTTETDPRLLGGVSGIEGLRFDPTRTDYIRDLFSVYGGGLPTIDVAPKVVAPVVGTTTPVVDAGGGGGGRTLPGFDVDSPKNTDFEQNLIDQGIGVQAEPGAPISAPGEGMLTQEAIDDLANYPITQPDQGVPVGEAYAPIDTVDYSELDDLEADLGAQAIKDFAPEQQGLIDQAFSKVGSTASDIMNDLSQIPGAVTDFANQTVDILGKKINVGATLLKAGIDKIVGGPISLVFDALGTLEPDKYNEEAQGALGEIDMLKTTEGGLTQDKYGINVQSAFGDYDDYNLERQIDLQEKVDDGTIQQYDEDGNLTYLGQELKDRKEIEQKLNETRLEEAGQEQQDFVQEIEAQPVVQAGSKEAKEQQDNTGVANVSTGIGGKGSGGYQTSSGDVYASAAEAAEKGDGGGGRGGKIVCTMMNDSYGFGSFRNKIWLKHSKDLAPEYQIGYHKIFLPLVKLSKTNKVLKKTLEHIAVHRTIDIRQEARGKMHLLGRIYRKILEPICYIVGKHAKR